MFTPRVKFTLKCKMRRAPFCTMSVCNFLGKNSNTRILAEFLNFFEPELQFQPKTRKPEFNGIVHKLSKNLVILKSCLGIGMVQGQVGWWAGGWV